MKGVVFSRPRNAQNPKPKSDPGLLTRVESMVRVLDILFERNAAKMGNVQKHITVCRKNELDLTNVESETLSHLKIKTKKKQGK